MVVHLQKRHEDKFAVSKNNHTTILQPYIPFDKLMFRQKKEKNYEDSIRTGYGLTVKKFTYGEDILTENGVEYRKFPFLEKKNNTLYKCDFETYIPFNPRTFFQENVGSENQRVSDRKIILWWQTKKKQPLMQGLNTLRGCPEFPCVITTNRNYTEDSSVMIVNVQFVDKEKPPKRRPDQVLVFYQVESSNIHTFWHHGDIISKDQSWNSAFNWTMSFRTDSDVPVSYGLVRKRLYPIVKDYESILRNKTGIVAWMSSNCKSDSKRENYVKELQKYIPVDVFGICGGKYCPRSRDAKCLEDIYKKYKFYLGFESSLCRDYITEKLFRFLNTDMIVIARGGEGYSQVLPSEIYLNTNNFKSPKELAERIMYLNSHDEEYINMLKGKDKYFVLFEDYPLIYKQKLDYPEYRYEAVSICQLCQRIWNIDKYAKTIPNMNAWFRNTEYQCQKPNDI
ncbi:alpha-(1,3)-fucosyltransferase fut-1-like [Physella acuta]|uniref:alpha-(1,3)-fucosyltransferase fut-1-like n=1 Tax=Physella acuta TaxID=109671 RepID=UPI0027DAC5A9|nr:alpha-(1,3)-fucosyltransferase fut-1-like [Physella acuta]